MPQGAPLVVTHRYGGSSMYSETPAQEVSKLREVYRTYVPMGRAWLFDPSRAAGILLATREALTMAGDHASIAVAANQITRILGPDGENRGDAKNVHCALTADGTIRTVTAVGDHVDATDPGELTTSNETSADHQVAYIPYETGLLTLEIHAALRDQVASYRVLEKETRKLFSMNQSKHLALQCPFWIPEDWSIVVRLSAAWQVFYVDGATGTSNVLDKLTRLDFPVFEERIGNLPGDIQQKALSYCASGVR